MGIRKISDHKTKEGIAKGLAEWVVVENGKSITVHDTAENVKQKYGKQKDSPEVVREEEQVEELNNVDSGLVVNSFAPGGTVSRQLLNVLSYEPRKAADLAAAIGRPVPSTRRTLNELATAGTILKTDEGYRSFV
jgi:predicted Rossmann fold nucleotide-binding protein DprA/Smf involved in DNA uptake